MKIPRIDVIVIALLSLALPACNTQKEEHPAEHHVIVTTNPVEQDVTIVQQFVCQIHSRRHIQVRALERGYLDEIKLKEGQPVKEGDVLFSVIPVLYQARLDARLAESNLAQLEYNFTNKLFQQKVVSENEVALKLANVKKTEANVLQARAELNFASVKAPFDGIVDRLSHQQGSLVEEGEALTTLSDNALMWVYFNVPEKIYLEFMGDQDRRKENLQVQLVLANGDKFHHTGELGAIEADFNNRTGTVPFRADFPNPEHLLRHGETGNVMISKVLKDSIVIPQRAVFEVLDRLYVYVVDRDDVAHQREIEVRHELEDIYVVKKGLVPDDKIVFEGVRQVRDGSKVECENRTPEQVSKQYKFHAE